jgi:hypothetical protein
MRLELGGNLAIVLIVLIIVIGITLRAIYG